MTPSKPRLSLGGLGRLALIAVVPALIALAHLFYGAFLLTPAAILCLAGASCLCLALCHGSVRAQLSALRPGWVPVLLFCSVLTIAALSETAWLPGEQSPLWAQAGFPASVALDRSAVTIEMLKIAGYACFFVLGCIMGATVDRARLAIRVILAIGGVSAMVSLLLFLSGHGMGYGTGRLLGGFYSANTAASLFGCLGVLSLALLFAELRSSARTAAVARITRLAPLVTLNLLFVTCLLLTGSRGGIASFLTAVLLLLAGTAFSGQGVRWRLLAACGLIGGISVALVLGGNDLIFDRFAAGNASSDSRWTILAAHWQAFLHAPLFGYGLGSYPQVNNQIMTLENYKALAETNILHNSYVQWLEEAGVVGATPMFLLIVVIVGATLWRTLRRSTERTLLIGLLCAAALVLLHAAIDVSLHVPSFAAFWSMLLGLGFAYSQSSPRRRTMRRSKA